MYSEIPQYLLLMLCQFTARVWLSETKKWTGFVGKLIEEIISVTYIFKLSWQSK